MTASPRVTAEEEKSASPASVRGNRVGHAIPGTRSCPGRRLRPPPIRRRRRPRRYTRRAFFNRSIVAMMGVSLASFGGRVWRSSTPARVGASVRWCRSASSTTSSRRPRREGLLLRARPRTGSPPTGGESPKARRPTASRRRCWRHEGGHQRPLSECPHLGCRVPQCETSQWFECPCHGSQYNRVGEKKGGPAPRGMDRFGVTITNGLVSVDTSNVFIGPPIGTNTTGQEAEGPHCIATVGGHA